MSAFVSEVGFQRPRRYLKRGGRRKRTWMIERLEDRSLLALFSVNSLLDTVDDNPGDGLAEDAAGMTTLRAAIMEANTFESDDLIQFISALADRTITLTLGELSISGNLTLTGLGSDRLAISGDNASRVFDIAAGATVDIDGLTIRDGHVAAGNGGGISNAGELTLMAVTIIGNSTGSLLAVGTKGGGIYNTGILSIADSTIAGNTATRGEIGNTSGGGIHSESGMVTITNSTISDNSATNGGAIYNGGAMIIKNCTITENFATTQSGSLSRSGQPGGVLNSEIGTLTIQNSIAAGNRVTTDFPISIDVMGAFDSLGNNLVGDSFGSSGWIASDILDIDARLGPLADNGGPTMTHALLPDSPAIDAGNNDGAPLTDQRGVARLIDGDGDGTAVIDIGAFELADIHGTPGNDTYLLRLDRAGTDVEVFSNDAGEGMPVFAAAVDSIITLAFNTLAGDDRLIVDFVNGNPLPEGGVQFVGGGQNNPGEDSLVVRGDMDIVGEYLPSQTTRSGEIKIGDRVIVLSEVETIDVSRFESFKVVTANSRDELYMRSIDVGVTQLLGLDTLKAEIVFSTIATFIIDAATNDAPGPVQ